MLKNYVKIAFKVFLRRKFYTFVSLFGISFTLTVLMVATALFDHIFGPFPPEVKTDRTLGVFLLERETVSGPRSTSRWTGPPSYAFLDRYVRTLPEVERVSIFTNNFGDAVGLSGVSYRNGEKIELALKRTDGEFWQILDFEFLEGRPFTVEDEKNAAFVAVINAATREKFFGKELAEGKTVEVDGQRFRVVGVVADVPLFRIIPFADIWVPLSTAKSRGYLDPTQLQGNFQALILVKKVEDIPLIKGEFQARLSQVEFPDPKATNKLSGEADTFLEFTSRLVFSSETGMGESQPGLLLAVIVGLMLLFMLLPALNLVNLNLSRILERAPEIGVRKAFGASSWTLIGQFVVENVLLTSIGGFIGFVLSSLVLHLLGSSNLIQYAQFHLNYRVFLYGLLVTLFFGIFSGVYPAWRMSHLHPAEALRGRRQ